MDTGTTPDILALLHREHLQSHESGMDALSAAMDALEKLGGSPARDALLSAFLHVGLRALEFQLLSDPALQNFVKNWPMMLGRQHELVRDRLEEMLKVSAPEVLVEYVVARLDAAAAIYQNREGQIDAEFETILTSRRTAGQIDLRCEICGYHFRPEDMSEGRRELVRDAGFYIATAVHPRRQGDSFKPLVAGKSCSLTTLTIDHVVPRSGLGGNSGANGAILCQLCNGGKIIYRRAREGISPMIASAAATWIDGTAHSLPRQITYVGVLLANSRQCSSCNGSWETTELTVRHIGSDPDRFYSLPWDLMSICYGCLTDNDRAIAGR